MHAKALELLHDRLRPGAVVLDVGSVRPLPNLPLEDLSQRRDLIRNKQL